MVLLGCGPLVFGAFSMVEDAMAFFSGNENRVKSLPFFFGFPLVIIRYMFIALCLQIMCLAVFLQTKLIVAWNTRGTKKKNLLLSKKFSSFHSRSSRTCGLVNLVHLHKYAFLIKYE